MIDVDTHTYTWKKKRCPQCGKGVVSPKSGTIQGHYCIDSSGNRYWRETESHNDA